MLNLKNKEGFTLVEIMVSLCIFSLIFTGVMDIMIASVKLEKWNKSTRNNLTCFKALKGIMESTMNYDDIVWIADNGRVYVTQENLDFNKIKSNDIKKIFSMSKPEKGSFISIEIEGDDVLTVKMVLYQACGREHDEFSTKFYKGNYKRYGI